MVTVGSQATFGSEKTTEKDTIVEMGENLIVFVFSVNLNAGNAGHPGHSFLE